MQKKWKNKWFLPPGFFVGWSSLIEYLQKEMVFEKCCQKDLEITLRLSKILNYCFAHLSSSRNMTCIIKMNLHYLEVELPPTSLLIEWTCVFFMTLDSMTDVGWFKGRRVVFATRPWLKIWEGVWPWLMLGGSISIIGSRSHLWGENQFTTLRTDCCYVGPPSVIQPRIIWYCISF